MYLRRLSYYSSFEERRIRPSFDWEALQRLCSSEHNPRDFLSPDRAGLRRARCTRGAAGKAGFPEAAVPAWTWAPGSCPERPQPVGASASGSARLAPPPFLAEACA